MQDDLVAELLGGGIASVFGSAGISGTACEITLTQAQALQLVLGVAGALARIRGLSES